MRAVGISLRIDLRYFEKLIGKNTTLSQFIPAISVLISKTIAVPCGLYFEQLATQQQGGIKKQAKTMKLDGLGFILGRELVFSMVFWTLNERLYRLFRESTTTVAATTLSALVSGIAGGVASYPLDALRTWKINFPEKFERKSSITVIRQISAEKGFGFLCSGLYLRSVRACIGNTVFFYLYALSSKTLDNIHLGGQVQSSH